MRVWSAVTVKLDKGYEAPTAPPSVTGALEVVGVAVMRKARAAVLSLSTAPRLTAPPALSVRSPPDSVIAPE